jgi:hydrogenase-4 component B
MTAGALLLAAAVCTGIAVFVARAARLWLAATMAGCAIALVAALEVLAHATTWNAHMTARGPALQMDGISAFFLVLVAVLGAMGAMYSHGYWRDREHPVSAPVGRAWWSIVLASMALVLIAANGLMFLVAWEVFSVGVYFLITRERHKPEVRSAGWLFLTASRAATLALVVFFAGLAARTGSWELGPMRDHPELGKWFWLALFGFGLKAGMFPLHIWLPSAHANAPSHVSGFLSGATIKLGIYGLIRFSGWLPTPESAGWVVAGLGAASAVLGVAFALAQHDLKRLLAYHSVENIGIILIGLGFAMVATKNGDTTWGRLALAGCLLHVWNHGVFKALLFFAAGSVHHATGTREMSRLGGLWRSMPWTAGLFALGAVAIAGLPPLNGFVSEWLVYLGLFGAVSAHGPHAWMAVPAAILLGMTGALALACFVKAYGVVFLGVPRRGIVGHECGGWMRSPMLVLGAVCVAVGLAPAFFWPALARAANAWRPDWAAVAVPAPLVVLGGVHVALALMAVLAAAGLWARVKHNGLERNVTWDCGYAAPTPRMQYTAGSFAATITSWFAWILRPEQHVQPPAGAFRGPARFEEHTPETVLERIVEPASRGVMQAAGLARRLQHGRLQAYVLYVLIGVAGIALLAVMRGSR